MNRPRKSFIHAESIAAAHQWISKILTMVVLMVGPMWLCERFIGRPVWTMVALILGVTLGVIYLLWVTGAQSDNKDDLSDRHDRK